MAKQKTSRWLWRVIWPKEKAGYLYALPAEPAYNLYGVGFDESRALENETYFGSFLPDELPAALEGGFGLVWDGDSAEPVVVSLASTFATTTLIRRRFI